MRIACSTAAFCRSPLEGAVRGVRELGFAEADLLVIEGWVHVNPTDLVNDWDGTTARVDALLQENGVRPIALNAGLSVLLHDRSAEACEQRRRQVAALARFAGLYSVAVSGMQPSLTGLDGRPVEQVFRDSVASLQEMAAIAEPAGLTLALECHVRSAFESLPDALRLLDEAPWLSVAYDPSHFAMSGVDLRETLPLLERAAHVHLRDAAPGRMQVHLGEGTVDFDWLLGSLRDQGYAGDVSIEYLGSDEMDVADDIRGLRDLVACALE